MQFRSLRSPIAVILMLSMMSSSTIGMVSSFTIGGFAKPASAGAPAAVGWVSLLVGIAATFKGFTGDNKTMRSDFTHRAIEALQREKPDYNAVVVNTGVNHKVEGPSVEEDFIHLNEFTYKVYLSRKGQPFKFELNGDGGWINWAYTGHFGRQGKTLIAR